MQLENGYFRIATELQDAFCKIRIPGEARQILDVIIRKTYGWNKKEDHISLSQFSEITGINRRGVVRAIKKLEFMNIIASVKKDTTIGNVYGINKNYSAWGGSVKKDTRGCQKRHVSKMVGGSVIFGQKVVSKKTHTINTIQKTLTKDNVAALAATIPKDWFDVFKIWIDYKKTKGQTYKTESSIMICYKKLIELSGNSLQAAKGIIEQSIAFNYSGLFTLKNNERSIKRESKFEQIKEEAQKYVETNNIF